MKKLLLVITMFAVISMGLTGCMTRTEIADSIHAATALAEEQSKAAIENHSDEVVTEILEKLYEKLAEEGIVIPEETKAEVVILAKELGKKYAKEGVEIAFDELDKAIDKWLKVDRSEDDEDTEG